MRDLTNQLILRADRDSHPLLSRGSGDKIGLIVITSDRGLCGGFNAGVVQRLMLALHEDFAGKDCELTIVGRKGAEILKRRPVKIRKTHIGVFDHLSINAASRIVDDLVAEFTDGVTSEVYCLYNEFKSAISQKPVLERLLPYEPEPADAAQEMNYIFEPSEERVLFSLLVKNIYVQMHRILHESAASEFGARMAAMESATKNAGDVIASLTLKYNRVRQDAITREVVEVVSGAQAL